MLELDAETQREIIAGNVKFNTAIKEVANIEPAKRAAAIEKAKKDNGGKATGAAISKAASELGAATKKNLPHTVAEFKAWLKSAIENTEVGPVQSFLFAQHDFFAGTISEGELNEKLEALSAEPEAMSAAA